MAPDEHLDPIGADEPVANGGGDLGSSPFRAPAQRTGALYGDELRMYAARHGWALTSIDVGGRYDVDDDGRGAIERMITVALDPSAEQRHRLAERTPVTVAVRAGTPITTRLRENQANRTSI